MRLWSVRGHLGHGQGLDGGGGPPSLSMRPSGPGLVVGVGLHRSEQTMGMTRPSPPPPTHTPRLRPLGPVGFRRIQCCDRPGGGALRTALRRLPRVLSRTVEDCRGPAVGAAHCTTMRGPVRDVPRRMWWWAPPPEVRSFGGDGVRSSSIFFLCADLKVSQPFRLMME